MIGALEVGNSQAATHQELKENYMDLCVLSWLGRLLGVV